jgi:endonuclease/exonuclease/phosphatase family metal-dependent hydrolase
VRCVTWNIQHGAEGLARVAEVLRSLAPDVVFLQEVDRGTARSDNADQAEILGHALGFHATFAEAFPFDGGSYGLALLTRGAPSDTRRLLLPHASPRRDDGHGEPRIVLSALWNGLHLGCTHLGLSPEERVDQAARLRTAFDTDAALILGGDFNEGPVDDVIPRLAPVLLDAFHEAGGAEEPTGPDDRPNLRIDFILRAPRAPRPLRASIGPAGASDHRPVIVDFEAP